ncbi:MAG TPA: folylpolyglutamate synthase/dihydrofolate synthase family protein [Nitrospirota bacterium]|nr:folylpolyglutamate synthase/dihydrofolate synthase family protein [Nitrospirota bacterium]
MPLADSYRETIDYLFALQKYGVKLALANTQQLMHLMGDPHRKFKSVHIAGTNGKGSTSTFIASMLMAAGFRVGLYTSPHLINFTERIRINGVQIPEPDVVALTGRVRKAYLQNSDNTSKRPLNPTFFEVTTTVAFTYFAESGVDIAVLEAGMGGRLDATNIVDPLVSVITNIDLDHMEYLGPTIELIAREKAGIIKAGVPLVFGTRQPEATAVIEGEAALKGCRSVQLGRDFSAETISGVLKPTFDYRGITSDYHGLQVQLAGRHQVDNACIAVAAIELLRDSGISIGDDSVRRGLAQAHWEGRMEQLAHKPDLYLDGAHNPASARALAAVLRELKPRYGKTVLVLGILGDKDYRSIISELVPLADHIVVTKPLYARALDVEALAGEVRKLHDAIIVTETVPDALRRARSTASPDDLIIVTGSLYVVGDARAALLDHTGDNGMLAGLKG